MNLSCNAFTKITEEENFHYGQFCFREFEDYFTCSFDKLAKPCSRKIRPFSPNYHFMFVDLIHPPLSSLTWIPGVNYGANWYNLPTMFLRIIINVNKENKPRIYEDDKVKDKILLHCTPIIIQDKPFVVYQAKLDTAVDIC